MDFLSGPFLLCLLFTNVHWMLTVDADDLSMPCNNLDAAVRYEGDLYLFSRNEYVKIDDTGEETQLGAITDWDKDMKYLSAAAKWTPDLYSFYNGSDLYIYSPVFGLAGPWNAFYGDDDFIGGAVVAAGQRMNETYLIKDCKYRSYVFGLATITAEGPLPDGLPCDLDAAWNYDKDMETLVLAKGDKMWLWGEDLQGPFDISKTYTLFSWKLCSFSDQSL